MLKFMACTQMRDESLNIVRIFYRIFLLIIIKPRRFQYVLIISWTRKCLTLAPILHKNFPDTDSDPLLSCVLILRTQVCF
jgi:hypothetical protein